MKKIILFLLAAASLSAQEFGFGFDDDDTAGSSGVNGIGVSVSGEVSAKMLGYFDDFSEGAESVRFEDFISGSLGFSAKAASAEGIINLNLYAKEMPVEIDEAYLRGFFGALDISAGLRKLTWGKADSFGPLDVINPLDSSCVFTEMADSSSLMSVKIARPLVHASLRFGQFSKIEGVFVPWFEPHRIAQEGRWSPAQMEMLSNPQVQIMMPIPVMEPFPMIITMPAVLNINVTEPDTSTLDYTQAGLRFTTTIGSADLGAQYYYGRLPQPSVKFGSVDFMYGQELSADVYFNYLYNPYHQIGLDYAQVFFGFNIRAELAANITNDLKGDDGSVYNPSIAWSLGFDRDLFLGVNLNLQVNESIRLMHDKLGNDIDSAITEKMNSNPMSIMTEGFNFDIEAGSPVTATRLTATITRKFLRDQLEARAAVVWGIEDMDCLIMPALIWTNDDLRIALAGGFFMGDSGGQLGQYKDNNFLKISMTYMF